MEQNLETAKKMLQEGIDISTIENITGLSKDEILKLHKNWFINKNYAKNKTTENRKKISCVYIA